MVFVGSCSVFFHGFDRFLLVLKALKSVFSYTETLKGVPFWRPLSTQNQPKSILLKVLVGFYRVLFMVLIGFCWFLFIVFKHFCKLYCMVFIGFCVEFFHGFDRFFRVISYL